jgi:hypothetical protein
MRTSMVLVLLAVVVGGIACSSSTSGLQTAYMATLNNSSIVPDTVTPSGGAATFTLNVSGNTISGTLSITTDPAAPDSFTVGHIHTGAAGSNGAILLNLCGTAYGLPACRGNINWTYTSPTSSTAMPGSAGAESYSAFITALGGGTQNTAYVQLHSTQDAGGEIRGQILRVDQGY